MLKNEQGILWGKADSRVFAARNSTLGRAWEPESLNKYLCMILITHYPWRRISPTHLSPSAILPLELCFTFLNNIFFLTQAWKIIEYVVVLILETQFQDDHQPRDFSCNDLFKYFFSSMAFNAQSVF